MAAAQPQLWRRNTSYSGAGKPLMIVWVFSRALWGLLLQMGKWKHGEIEGFALGHISGKTTEFEGRMVWTQSLSTSHLSGQKANRQETPGLVTLGGAGCVSQWAGP